MKYLLFSWLLTTGCVVSEKEEQKEIYVPDSKIMYTFSDNCYEDNPLMCECYDYFLSRKDEIGTTVRFNENLWYLIVDACWERVMEFGVTEFDF
jgi:hypothetical protein